MSTHYISLLVNLLLNSSFHSPPWRGGPRHPGRRRAEVEDRARAVGRDLGGTERRDPFDVNVQCTTDVQCFFYASIAINETSNPKVTEF